MRRDPIDSSDNTEVDVAIGFVQCEVREGINGDVRREARPNERGQASIIDIKRK